MTAEDAEAWTAVHQAAITAVDVCLAPTGWTGQDLGRGNVAWTRDALPTVHVELFQMSGEGYVRVEVKNK